MKESIRNITALSGVLAVCIMALVLVSGRATINFTHTPMIAKIHEDSYYKIVDDGDIHIYLSTTIAGPEVYRTLVHTLLTNKDRTIKIYLAGYGGRSDSALTISNAMLKSKSNVVVIMTGNVASAHAIIAANGHELRSLSPHFVMMFHVAAIADREKGEYVIPKEYCKKYIGMKDRRQDRYKKCIDAMEAYERSASLSSMIKAFNGMSAKERDLYLKGHDVYIPVWKFLLQSAGAL